MGVGYHSQIGGFDFFVDKGGSAAEAFAILDVVWEVTYAFLRGGVNILIESMTCLLCGFNKIIANGKFS